MKSSETLSLHSIPAIQTGVSTESGMHGSKKNGPRTIDPVPESKTCHEPNIAIASRTRPSRISRTGRSPQRIIQPESDGLYRSAHGFVFGSMASGG